jgi:membrane-bound inhibitor of C-type lysozyme
MRWIDAAAATAARLIGAALLLASGFPATALAQTSPPDVPEGVTARYACAAGVRVEVAYINAADGASYAVVAHAEGLVPMKAGPTGSGVRYVALDGSGLVWHTKGDAGFLARDDAGVTMIAADCLAEAP